MAHLSLHPALTPCSQQPCSVGFIGPRLTEQEMEAQRWEESCPGRWALLLPPTPTFNITHCSFQASRPPLWIFSDSGAKQSNVYSPSPQMRTTEAQED